MRERIEQDLKPSGIMKFLYCNKLGGIILKIITRRWVSKLAGAYLDSRLSTCHIKRFIKKHGIDMSLYEEEKYKSFNAFFTRNKRAEFRSFDANPDALCSPCDCKLTVYPITPDGEFEVKGFSYTAETLLQNAELAKQFYGGTCLIFRLTVTDYHRYRFFDGGEAEKSVYIKGRYYTVQPIALGQRRVFTENCREYTVLHTDNFGDAVQIEVGATMVGRIVNDHGEGRFERGDEKGRFEFGGSTVILFLQKDAAFIDDEIVQNTAEGYETIVKCGETLGRACRAADRSAPPEENGREVPPAIQEESAAE